MKFIQILEERALRGVSKLAARHEWRFRLIERHIERLVERKSVRALDWMMPPWRKGKVLTRYVEPDTKPVKDLN